VVVVEQRTDVLVAKLMSQGLYDAVRYASIFLFMIGLLLIGLRLMRFLEKHISFAHIFSHHIILALISFAVIATFLGTALYFSLNPGNLAGLSAKIHHLEEEHPCQRLKIQQDHLNKVKEIGDEGLINATLDRVKEAYEE
jgi:predicted membrane protein